MKIKYYDLGNILSLNAQYNIIFGERANGKSFAVKKYCISEGLKGNKFVYLRRYSIDTTANMVTQYFDDMDIKKLTNNEYDSLEVKSRKINLIQMDYEKMKVKKRLQICYVMHLSGAEHYKSMSYPNTENMIFEEFVTNEGYLLDEPTKLMNIVSTVFRNNEGKVFMIGNTVNRICPYFSEWQLTNIPTQEQGSIDTYTVKYDDVSIKIACEYCGNAENKKNKMFFGRAADNIIGGSWEVQAYPKPPSGKDYIQCRILLNHTQFKYSINVMTNENGECYIKVTPQNKMDTLGMYQFILTQEFNTNPLHVKTLQHFTIGKLLRKLYNSGKICYSDNLTGTEFNNIIKDWLIW